jgi:hypothetical protein
VKTRFFGRALATGAVAALIATTAPVVAAHAATEPTFPSTSDAPVYVIDGGEVVSVAAGTQLPWDWGNTAVLSSKPLTGAPSNYDDIRLPAPPTDATQMVTFLSDPGAERTQSAWKAYADSIFFDSQRRGALMSEITPYSFIYGGIATVKAQGGTYSAGVAYTKNNGLTVVEAYYTTINVDAVTGTWKFATPAGPAKTATTTSLSAPASATVGDNVTLTATVAPAAATGTVTFKDGSSTLGTGTLSGGTASFSTTALAGGSHSIVASYSGDTDYAGSDSAASTVAIKADTTAVLSADATSVEAGTKVILTAAVDPATASGNVEFFEDGASIGTGAVASGSAIKSVTKAAAESHAYTAKFVANSLYNASAASNSVNVAWTPGATAPVPDGPSENALVDANKNGLEASIGTDGRLHVSQLPAAQNGQTVNVFAYSNPTFLGTVTVTDPTAGFALEPEAFGALTAGTHKVAVVSTDGTVLAWTTFDKATAAGNSFSKPINAVVQTQEPADGEFSLKDLSGTTSIELTNPVQTSNGSLSSGKLGQLVVTDLRKVTTPGWDLKTTVGTFTRQGGTDTIANSALGVAPSLVKQAGTGATAPTLASSVDAGSGSYPYTFATVANGGWSGETTYDADLSFLAPQSAPAGTYSSTLTLTLTSK